MTAENTTEVIEQVDRMAKMFDQYGFAALIAGILTIAGLGIHFYFVYRAMNSSEKRCKSAECLAQKVIADAAEERKLTADRQERQADNLNSTLGEMTGALSSLKQVIETNAKA